MIWGQSKNKISRELIESRMETQLSVYPQEKIHLHVDRTYYVPGEKIWFKAYLADASSLQSTINSRYVYVELINPLDSLIRRIKISSIDDLYYGHIPLPDDLAEGSYTIRSYTRYMDNPDQNYFFQKPIHIGSLLSSQIKPVINFRYEWNDKKVYIDLHYTDGEGSKKIKLDRLALRNEKGIMRNIRMDRDTSAHVTLNLPLPLQMKALYIEADNYHHYIPFPSDTNESYDVSFYPEGGYLLDNVLCKVSFKALNSHGLAEGISGVLLNEENEVLSLVKSFHAGMGTFAFIPEKGKRYFLECTNATGQKKQFELPEAISTGYNISTQWREGNLYASIKKTRDIKKNEPTYLLIHSRGKILYFESIEGKEILKFHEHDLPSGVLHAILLNKDMVPLSERLIFCQGTLDQAETKWIANQNTYKTRDKISAQIRLTDNMNTPLEGNMSIAITDDADVAVDSCVTILTSLLLTSEVKGHIEDPGFYFRDTAAVSTHALDILMMTHGWRRYNIPEVLKGEFTYSPYPFEIADEISGRLQQLMSSKPVEKGKVSILATNESSSGWFIDDTETDKEGRFYFGALEFPDSTNIFVQSYNPKGKEHVRLSVDDISYPDIQELLPWTSKLKTKQLESLTDTYIEKAEQRALYDDNMRIIHLGEVEVTAPRKEKKEEHSIYSSIASSSFDLEEIERVHPIKAEDMLYRISGLRIENGGDHTQKFVYIRNELVTIFIDDMPAADQESALSMINIFDIERIDVFKGASASIFGLSGGPGGVINFITKRGGASSGQRETYNTKLITPLGFQKPVEFYSPVYETPQQKSSYLPDLRTTIYWKPDVLTDAEGKADIEFYSADSPTTYSVIIEGLTTDGKIIRSVEKIKVE